MEKNYPFSGWVKAVALSAAFYVAATAARAQTTAFATGFDGTDVVNGTATATTYASPNFSATYTSNTDPNATGPTAPLASQNGWTTNDAAGPIGHGVFSPGNANQINGGTTAVGGIQGSNGTPYFGGTQAGVIGGIYAPAAQTPYAVPSTAAGGVVNVAHPVTVPTGTTQVVFNTDLAVLATDNIGQDTFAFTLANTAGAAIVSVNFVPTATASNQDNVTATGATTVNPGAAIVLNSTYHLRVALTPGVGGAAGTFLATLTGTGNATSFGGTLAAAVTTISQFQAVWTLSPTSLAAPANGGYVNAGDNYLAFDNIVVTVPEPSTYVMMALGLAGLVGMLRLRRQQA